MKTAVLKTCKFLLITWISIQAAVAQPASRLEIHKNEHWRAMLEQWFILKYTTPEFKNNKIELEHPSLRADLTMQDLIEQVKRIIEKDFSHTDYLLQLNNGIDHFDRWYSKLNELASKDEELKKQLDRKLLIQEYNQDGVALVSGIPMLRLKRIRLIEKYNRLALDPEGSGILERLSKEAPLTVLAANKLSKEQIDLATEEQYQNHYQEMFELEEQDRQKYGENANCTPRLKIPHHTGKPLSMTGCRFKAIFNTIEKLPGKKNFIRAIDEEMNHTLTRTSSGEPILTPSFIQRFENELIPVLKDITWRKQLSIEDDETLFLFRKWLKKNRELTREKLEAYNQSHQTNLTLPWLESRGLPRRAETIENYEILHTIFSGEEPWQDEISTVLRNKRGKEVVIGKSIVGTVIRKIGIFMRNLVKSENLAGIAAGTGAFFLSSGNLPIAMMANSVTHDVVANRKYDRNPRELLTQIPNDLLAGALTQTGFQPGRIFNVLALGAGSGFIQGITTRQDPLKSMLVGATFEAGLELLPGNIKYPLVSGVSRNALAKNAAIEIFTTSAKTTIRGGVVAIWEKQDVVDGMAKGAIYGATSAVLKIIVLGVRFDPLEGHTADEIQATIEEENTFDNANGAPGGNYQITENTIRKTPYRTGGWLTAKITASIALPGSVSIYSEQLGSIETVVHEAHHLSQQEQLGLLNFYFQYVMEASHTPYEEISFEISPH